MLPAPVEKAADAKCQARLCDSDFGSYVHTHHHGQSVYFDPTVLHDLTVTRLKRCIIDTIRCIVAFSEFFVESTFEYRSSDYPGNDSLDFGPPNTTMGIVTNACWFFVTAVADAFIVCFLLRQTCIRWTKTDIPYFHRLEKKLVCYHSAELALPRQLRCVSTLLLRPLPNLLRYPASSIWLIYSIIIFDPNAPVFGPLTKSVNAFIYLTLFTNVLCTGVTWDLSCLYTSLMITTRSHFFPYPLCPPQCVWARLRFWALRGSHLKDSLNNRRVGYVFSAI